MKKSLLSSTGALAVFMLLSLPVSAATLLDPAPPYSIDTNESFTVDCDDVGADYVYIFRVGGNQSGEGSLLDTFYARSSFGGDNIAGSAHAICVDVSSVVDCSTYAACQSDPGFLSEADVELVDPFTFDCTVTDDTVDCTWTWTDQYILYAGAFTSTGEIGAGLLLDGATYAGSLPHVCGFANAAGGSTPVALSSASIGSPTYGAETTVTCPAWSAGGDTAVADAIVTIKDATMTTNYILAVGLTLIAFSGAAFWGWRLIKGKTKDA